MAHPLWSRGRGFETHQVQVFFPLLFFIRRVSLIRSSSRRIRTCEVFHCHQNPLKLKLKHCSCPRMTVFTGRTETAGFDLRTLSSALTTLSTLPQWTTNTFYVRPTFVTLASVATKRCRRCCEAEKQLNWKPDTWHQSYKRLASL